jgi:hypothetical protein
LCHRQFVDLIKQYVVLERSERMIRLALSVVLFLAASRAQAQKAEEMGTPEQRAACSGDVGRYCKSVKPEDGPFAYLDCLSKNREKLRPACLKVIGGGEPLK